MFWLTKGTFKKLYPDECNFNHFDPEHLVMLAIFAAITAAAVFLYCKLNEENREKYIKILAIAMIIDELWKHIGCIATGQWNAEYLPLHLCSINIFVCCWYAIKPTKLGAEILYGLCLPGATLALLMPTWNVLPHWNFMSLHSTTIHLMLVILPLALLFTGFKPNFRNLPKVLAVLVCEVIPIFFFNKLASTNFFFLNGTENNGLLEFLAGIFGEDLYIIGLVIILAVVWLFMYAPWEMVRKKSIK